MKSFLKSSLYIIIAISLGTYLAIYISKKNSEQTLKEIQLKIVNAEKAVYPLFGFNNQQFLKVGTAFQIKYHDKIYLITAGHVCIGLNNMENSMMTALIEVNGIKYSLNESHILANDDVCVIKSTGYQQKEYLELENTQPKVNDDLYTIGYPGIVSQSFMKMFISGKALNPEKLLNLPMNGYPLFEKELNRFSRRTYPGQSGSPVLNSKGNVIGIIVLTDHIFYIGMFTGVDNLIKYLDQNP